MSIHFYCSHCGDQIKAPDAIAGRRAKCPACGAVVLVPGDKLQKTSPSQTKASSINTNHANQAARKEEAATDIQSQATAGLPQGVCPLCDRQVDRSSQMKELYGVLVCQKCQNGFAARRQVAFVLDYIFLLLAAGFLGLIIVGFGGPIMMSLLFLLKDSCGHGVSPAKTLLNLQVVNSETKKPIGVWRSFLRNLPLLPIFFGCVFVTALLIALAGGHSSFLFVVAATLLLPPSIIALAMGSFLRKGPRLGDGWAKTMVVRKKYRHKAPFAAS